MDNQELISTLEIFEALLIPACFVCDMEAVKGQMLDILDKMSTNTMSKADVVAVLEIFLAYLRQEESK